MIWRFAPAFLVLPALAQHVGTPTDDLDKLSVDELFSLQVTSVDRKAQELSKAPAAVFVLTADDIRRSGATSIPEALEWVPGLTVLREDGRSWVVSARGGASLYADKMLVMVDGNSLYTPTFSGVFWDLVPVQLDQIERIEIVRGPGAVMWGPNAVNGVINIITKTARPAPEGQASQTTGNEVRDATALSWQGPGNDRIAYRVWGNFQYLTPAFGSPGYDRLMDTYPYQTGKVTNLDEGSGGLGFRMDGSLGPRDQWTAEGYLYKEDRQDPVVYPVVYPGTVDAFQSHSDSFAGSFLGRWTRTSSPGSESTVQFSFLRNNIDLPYLYGQLNNLTIDYQKRRQVGERNEIYWGAGFQQYWDSTQSQRFIAFIPDSAVYRSGDAVVRDEYQLIPGRLLGSAGVRLDYNSFTHLEYQPSLRLLFTPDSRQSLWMAVSRAVRVPSRLNRDLDADMGEAPLGSMDVSVFTYGSPSLKSEVERSIEAGYRFQSGQRWSVDGSLFWSYYERLAAPGGPSLQILGYNGLVPDIAATFRYGNVGAGRSYGAEIWGAWQVREGWRLLPAYSYLNETYWWPPSAGADTGPSTIPHQFLLRSQHDLSRKLQFDLMARARSRDTSWNLPGALLLDARLGWRPTRSSELSVGVQNLTDRRLLEVYAENPFVSIPIRRTFVIKFVQRM